MKEKDTRKRNWCHTTQLEYISVQVYTADQERKRTFKGSVKLIVLTVSRRIVSEVLVQNKQSDTGTELVRLVFFRWTRERKRGSSYHPSKNFPSKIFFLPPQVSSKEVQTGGTLTETLEWKNHSNTLTCLTKAWLYWAWFIKTKMLRGEEKVWYSLQICFISKPCKNS